MILLTNTGFIGRALEDHFKGRGLDVHGFSSASLDLRQATALSRLDGLLDASSCLVVTAATAPGSAMTPAALADNVAMIANLATYLETTRSRTCVYLSSDAVYPMIDTAVRPRGHRHGPHQLVRAVETRRRAHARLRHAQDRLGPQW